MKWSRTRRRQKKIIYHPKMKTGERLKYVYWGASILRCKEDLAATEYQTLKFLCFKYYFLSNLSPILDISFKNISPMFSLCQTHVTCCRNTGTKIMINNKRQINTFLAFYFRGNYSKLRLFLGSYSFLQMYEVYFTESFHEKNQIQKSVKILINISITREQQRRWQRKHLHNETK